MKLRPFILSFALIGLSAQAQRAADPVVQPRQQLAAPAEKPRPASPRRMPGTEPKEAELLSHRHYQARDGHRVHSPAKSSHDLVPAGASAQCRDGSYSFSQHRRGTCSHHGGVSAWL
jgi:hypothetical protein